MTGVSHHTQPLVEMGGAGVSGTFCMSWPQTAIFPISTSQVAKIMGLNLCACPISHLIHEIGKICMRRNTESRGNLVFTLLFMYVHYAKYHKKHKNKSKA
jgi:hypothetical protein